MKKLLMIMLISAIGLQAVDKTLSIFYKERKPSKQVLAKVKTLLQNYKKSYKINYYNIEDKKTAVSIKEIGLPETHFPFAVVIDGKFTAKINDKTISFVHFPIFMKGIGRHEGNWSLDALKKVLNDNKLLITKNILPVLESNETKCNDHDEQKHD